MEVYGIKPKRFTKEWWGYFWDYYKWHTIGGGFVAFLVITSCVQCITQTKYDLQVDYISEYGILSEHEDALRALAEEKIEDVTGNGKNEVSILSLNMSQANDPQMMQAMQTKFVIEMGYSEGYAFILTKQYADLMTEQGVLEPTSAWAGEYANDGCVISLSGCTALSEIGIDASEQDLYIGIHKVREKEKEDELEVKRYENGVRFAQYLINQR